MNCMAVFIKAFINYLDMIIHYFQKELIRAGANVNVQNYDRVTPLHLAVKRHEKDCAQILVDHYIANNIAIPDELKPQLKELGVKLQNSGGYNVCSIQ